ncbi:FHA domain-containing protein [Streptomyces sp. NPDC092369]|uniref:FHA domain-containing protein n=1 Tax=Streptomyces sp. NPDC092369 TaxID=3366015 RepID=UPI003819D205
MQIRLTVVDPLGPPDRVRGRTASCDVLVTAPAGTALAEVASALSSAVSGDGSAPPSERAREGGGPVVLYVGAERLDDKRCTLGEPPLIDGAVLSLGAPAEPEPHPELDDAPTQLHVIAGPDAGGVHLLHGGEIRIGRSADADVPLDDPDVSRLHCAVTVGADGRVSVADLGSTNGTLLDGTRVSTHPVRLAPGALLRVGESALRLTPAGGPGARVPTAPDGEGHVRVSCDGEQPGTDTKAGSPDPLHARVADGGDTSTPSRGLPAQNHGPADPLVPGQGGAPRIESRGTTGPAGGSGDTHAGRFGVGAWTANGDAGGDRDGTGTGTVGAGSASARNASPFTDAASSRAPSSTAPFAQASSTTAHDTAPHDDPSGTRSRDGIEGAGVRKRGGIAGWARRLTGGRGEHSAADQDVYDTDETDDMDTGADLAAGSASTADRAQAPETWPDLAALLLTALGPGPRLWEREPGHREALTVRLGTADRTAPDGSGLLPAVPVTADLREAGALGLAGPRTRLSGLARAVVAQLAALHSPEALEIVLISADRARPAEDRGAEWAWLGWLPHVRPGHGQDCGLLLAYDREQATARTDELLRRLDETPATAHTVPAARRSEVRSAPRRPSWAKDDGAEETDGFAGPYTLVIVDGDTGGAAVREAVARLAVEGPRVGIHVLCLAETAPASPASPVTDTYEAACAAAPAFRQCGAVALLSGDVATALRLMRVARGGTGTPEAVPGTGAGTPSRLTPSTSPSPVPSSLSTFPSSSPSPSPSSSPSSSPDQLRSGSGTSDSGTPGSKTPGPVGPGSVAAVDAVSLAWAERFARALAPLRMDGAGRDRHARVSLPLPQAARLLDELGLARATPASLMARWADAADDTQALGGRAAAVLGAGPRGPVGADLVVDGPHLVIEGPTGSGRTELLRAVVASLAAAERPDRLGIVLIDGRDSVGTAGGHGEGLRVCTDVPHVTTHLTANDPVRMREFAQSLSAELKRRAELLGRGDFAEWHASREMSGRLVSQRASGRGSAAAQGAPGASAVSGSAGASDLDTAPSSTMRLRPAAARRQTEAAPPLPRLVVVVDDLDALVSPALGSPGRPAAGSVMRALEAVAREGERLGVHLVAATSPGGRTAETEPSRRAALRVTLDAPTPGPDEPSPGRGRLTWSDGRATPFQGGRVTGRIPRTATLRPTVVPVDWQRMGDPPARRHVRELGNGPTDLALLASALERATREVSATTAPSLL